jgi:hypothetical protein
VHTSQLRLFHRRLEEAKGDSEERRRDQKEHRADGELPGCGDADADEQRHE